ncbi:hypothetical protein HY643_01755 [Candidatus Woesearchaeota archaeon]|nr:hypothetical protein [Candidatus Woesearchaeota archaeon]
MVYKKLIATTGIVLAGSLSLAAPLQQTNEPANQQKSLKSEKELINNYAQTLEKAVEDGVIDYKEVLGLHSVLKSYFNQQQQGIVEPSPKPLIQEGTKEVLGAIEEKILVNYPGLINKQEGLFVGISYPATQTLNEEEKKAINELAKKYPNNTDLKILEEKTEVTVVELAKTYLGINKIIEQAAAEEKIQLESFRFVNLSGLDVNKLKRTYDLLDNYAVCAEKFQKKISEYISPGILDYDSASTERYVKSELYAIINAEFSSQINRPFEAKIREGAIPKKVRIPWLPIYASLPLGLIVPIARIAFMQKWTGRRVDLFDIFDGGGNILSGLIFDGIHPLVYPTRLIAPIVFEPIRKAMGWQA